MRWILICISLLSYPLIAKDLSKGLDLKGKASFHKFFFHIYDAKLWTEKQDDIYQGKILLKLTYKRSIDGEDITEQTKKELLYAKYSKDKVSAWMAQINDLFPNVEDGDQIKAFYRPKHGIDFYFNGDKVIGKIEDLEFSIAFLGIWLSEKSSDQSFRNKLLGVNND